MSKKVTTEEKFRAASGSYSGVGDAGYSDADLRDAGYSAAELRAAGYGPAELRAAGYSDAEMRAAGYSDAERDDMLNDVPLIDKPYTRLWADIQAKRRQHQQSTWGPDEPTSEKNICKTPMCTAGHLINMAGEAGWKLKQRYGWAGAAALLHMKAHPDLPPQNFGFIPQDWALAYIETMAAKEATTDFILCVLTPIARSPL